MLGTHTHVPTGDEQILAKGTGYLTDIGMVGPFPSVLGVKSEIIIEKFKTEEKIRHQLPETGQVEINAVLLEIENILVLDNSFNQGFSSFLMSNSSGIVKNSKFVNNNKHNYYND